MNDLIDLIVQKVGLTPEQADQTVKLVLAYIKDRLPEPVAGAVENLMKGGTVVEELLKGGSVTDELLKGLGDWLKQR